MEDINSKAYQDELNKDEQELSNKFDRKTAKRIKERMQKATQAEQDGETFEK